MEQLNWARTRRGWDTVRKPSRKRQTLGVRHASLAVGLLAALTACAGSATPTPQATGVVVTVRVASTEQYRIRLTDPADIAVARQLLAGQPAPRIPNGLVVRGDSDVNVGCSWHIDPASVEFADLTTEVCDGLPSDVEKGAITSDQYCPWSVQVIAIEP